ncbi:hypothetical protein HDK90DRAFT_135366 [Phyllosticta capitalensis]|uniref:Uncharacterized protein n=1 Tax=Phyllosticta capitalensis TaxID=121624 RepID=A0ABR1YYR5_9PEZI
MINTAPSPPLRPAAQHARAWARRAILCNNQTAPLSAGLPAVHVACIISRVCPALFARCELGRPQPKKAACLPALLSWARLLLRNSSVSRTLRRAPSPNPPWAEHYRDELVCGGGQGLRDDVEPFESHPPLLFPSLPPSPDLQFHLAMSATRRSSGTPNIAGWIPFPLSVQVIPQNGFSTVELGCSRAWCFFPERGVRPRTQSPQAPVMCPRGCASCRCGVVSDASYPKGWLRD